MRKLVPITLLLACCALAGTALAFDNGQYENVPPDIRAWFKGVIAPNGVPCCDISDGHRTEYDYREGAYWVPIEGQWMQVPAHAIIRDRPYIGRPRSSLRQADRARDREGTSGDR